MKSADLPNMSTIDLTKKDGEKVQMTPDEMRRFQECMKDPKFLDLWQDYAREISDPKNLKEQEEYLQQVEREAKEQGDHSFTFIFPKPNFCVKMNCKEIIFINICDDEKVDEPKEHTTGNLQASSWEVPVCLGKLRDDTFEDKECKVVDACYHPKATYLAKKSDKFMVFLVEIAVENMNHTYKDQLPCTVPTEFRRVTTVDSIGNPSAQTLRIKAVKGKEGELVVEKKNKGHQPDRHAFKDNAAFAERLAASMGDSSAKERIKAKKQAEQEQEQARLEQERLERERKAADEKKREEEFKKNLAAGMGGGVKEKPQPCVQKNDRPPNFPEYTITQQGSVGYEDCWNRTEDIDRKLPKSLKLTVMLPDVKKASDIDMHIEPLIVSLASEKHGFEGDVKLPYEVDADNTSAKFEKNKKVLTVVMPVVQKMSEEARALRMERAEKMRKFREEAAEQAAEERKQKEEEARRQREEREAELREQREREEKEAERKRKMQEMLEKAAEEERLRHEEEQRAKEAAMEKEHQEKLQKKLQHLEATKESMYKQEEEFRQEAEKEREKLMRKIKKEMEAAKLAESATQQSKKKQDELPFTTPLVFELD
eukprot:TRINITY_DN23484_c0_g1_i2.p1 TRINITY_DN23484_c0_g1~~TRINITY_DN23484_c0_g1_i2.p1  ORF type:complete len:597 (+),score=230.94 TRINITY_DN23484_c0_g1_i2:1636-3426(+)